MVAYGSAAEHAANTCRGGHRWELATTKTKASWACVVVSTNQLDTRYNCVQCCRGVWCS
jgi:hypothetical protein